MEKTKTPILEDLSYLLRHEELWPDNFRWDFTLPTNCAMGLAKTVWGEEGDSSHPAHWVEDMFGDDIDYLFYNKERSTPELIADAIDRHVKEICDAV